MLFFTSVIILSCIYATLAIGFVLIYKSSRVLNFSYSYMVVFLAYLAISLIKYIKIPYVALIIGLLLSFVMGLLIYMILIKPMASQPIYSIIILTVALGMVIQSLATLIWRGDSENLTLGWNALYPIGKNIKVSSVDLVIVGTTLIFFSALILFYKYSTIGRQMKATAEKVLLAAQRGINVYFITAVAWGIGITATALAAILLGAYSSVSLQMGHIAIKAFAVALVGGLDSIPGVIPAAIIVALAELAANNYVNPRLADAIPFMIMLIVLLVRPWGLFGTEEEIERV